MAIFSDVVCSQFMKKVSLSCADCICSVVSNFQGIRNRWLKDTRVIIWEPWVMIQLNAVHQYNLGTTNMDFKTFDIQTNFGIVLYADNVLTVS